MSMSPDTEIDEFTQVYQGTMHYTTPHLTSPYSPSTTPNPNPNPDPNSDSGSSSTLTPSTNPTKYQTFTLFPLLPPELRLKIFSYTLPSPTLHTISLPTCPSTCLLPTCPRQHVPRTTSSLTTLLSVNREAREECLRTHTILISELGRGFTLAFDSKRDSVYFCNGRGAGEGGEFWSVRGKWPEGIKVAGYGDGGVGEEKERGKIGNLVIDEATLERGDYLKFPKEMLALKSVTILLMPWSSPLSAFGSHGQRELVRTFSDSGSDSGLDSGVVRGNDRDWGLKELRREFMEWLEEKRVELRKEQKPVVKVAQWGACLKAGEGEGSTNRRGQWKLVETGLWVHWEYNGRETFMSS